MWGVTEIPNKGEKELFPWKQAKEQPQSLHAGQENISLENSSVLGCSAQGRNVPGLTTLILIKGFMTKCEEEAGACAELRIIWSGYF